jgi:hypothetical protein
MRKVVKGCWWRWAAARVCGEMRRGGRGVLGVAFVRLLKRDDVRQARLTTPGAGSQTRPDEQLALRRYTRHLTANTGDGDGWQSRSAHSATSTTP